MAVRLSTFFACAFVVAVVLAPLHAWRAVTASTVADVLAHAVLAIISVVFAVRSWRHRRTAQDIDST